MAGCCECGNEPPGSIKWGELVEELVASQEGFCCTELVSRNGVLFTTGPEKQWIRVQLQSRTEAVLLAGWSRLPHTSGAETDWLRNVGDNRTVGKTEVRYLIGDNPSKLLHSLLSVAHQLHYPKILITICDHLDWKFSVHCFISTYVVEQSIFYAINSAKRTASSVVT